MTKTITAGEQLHGFCGGEFGRDSYGDHLVVLTFGWKGKQAAVFEADHGTDRARLVVLHGDDLDWAIKTSENDDDEQEN